MTIPPLISVACQLQWCSSKILSPTATAAIVRHNVFYFRQPNADVDTRISQSQINNVSQFHMQLSRKLKSHDINISLLPASDQE